MATIEYIPEKSIETPIGTLSRSLFVHIMEKPCPTGDDQMCEHIWCVARRKIAAAGIKVRD